MATVRIKIDGQPGQVTLAAFLGVVSNVGRILAELDAAISEQPHGSLDWVVDDLFTGSLGAELRSEPRTLDREDAGAAVVRAFVGGWQTIETEGRTPPLFSPDAMQRAKSIVRFIGKEGATGIEISDTNETVELSPKSAVNVTQLLKEQRRSRGSVEGKLETVSVHRGARVIVYHSRTRKAIRCRLPDELLEQASTAMRLRQRVIVSGTIFSNGKGEPLRIDVTKLRILPPDSELPRYNDIGGHYPDFTGEMSTRDYIRSIRVG